MRKTLRALLEFGHRPMNYYATDLSKYFYFGELMALVDLSLVCSLLHAFQVHPCQAACALESRQMQAGHLVHSSWQLMAPCSPAPGTTTPSASNLYRRHPRTSQGPGADTTCCRR